MMSDVLQTVLPVGQDENRRDIAIKQRPGGSPGLFWLGGFKSDMEGSKALALDALAAREGWAMTRFDYSGHGVSTGAFLDGSISDWLEDSLKVFGKTNGPQIIIGSSMGGWLALLLNKALKEAGENRVAGIVLIAPAVDMTEDLMRATFTPEELHDLHNKGRVEQPSDYSDEPYVLTEKLIVDGAKHLLFGHGSIITGCPVHILQGGEDTDVPTGHALKLLSHLTSDPVSFTLVPDGDHRLSRDEDLELLKKTVKGIVEG